MARNLTRKAIASELSQRGVPSYGQRSSAAPIDELPINHSPLFTVLNVNKMIVSEDLSHTFGSYHQEFAFS